MDYKCSQVTGRKSIEPQEEYRATEFESKTYNKRDKLEQYRSGLVKA
jgi:hypothetical protein